MTARARRIFAAYFLAAALAFLTAFLTAFFAAGFFAAFLAVVAMSQSSDQERSRNTFRMSRKCNLHFPVVNIYLL